MYQLAKRQVQRGIRRVNAEVGRPLLQAQEARRGVEDATSLYQQLPEGYIRLLKIHTSKDGAASWRLETYPLNLAPRYDAVSYSWGDDKTPTWINVNGFMLRIRKTLMAFLQASVHRDSPLRPLWIDVICLNQESDVEKTVQVPLMGEVYKNASRTIEWLGEPDEGTFDALIFMKSVMKYSESNEDLEAIGKDVLHPQEWAAVRRYLQRPWFQRLWVLQEVLLSDKIEILCHARKVDYERPINVLSWKELLRFERMLQDRGAYGNLVAEDDEEFEGYGIARSALFMESVRGILQRSGGHLRMSTLREYHHSRRCLEPVDRVWGLLGLLSPKLRTKVHEARIIDYSDVGRSEYWTSYVAFMEVLHAFDVTDFFDVITDDIGRKSASMLPSWCVDFNTPRRYNAFSTFRKFRAGFVGPQDRTAIESSLSSADDALSITGFLVDQVSVVTSVFSRPVFEGDAPAAADDLPSQKSLEEIRMFLRWLDDCNALCSKTFSGSLRATKSAMCHTVLAADKDPKTLEFARAAAKKQEVAEESILIEAHTSMINSFKAFSRGDKVEEPFVAACDNRIMFATQLGRIGLGPPDLKIGDQICTIIGAETLFALRSADYSPWLAEVERRSQLVAPPAGALALQETFRLVGDAYVHGLMFGEAFAAKGRGPTRELCLV